MNSDIIYRYEKNTYELCYDNYTSNPINQLDLPTCNDTVITRVFNNYNILYT